MAVWKIIREAVSEFFSPGFGLYDRQRAKYLDRRIMKMRAEIIALQSENARIQALHTGLMAEADRRYAELCDHLYATKRCDFPEHMK